jgi:hypothetical protein
VKLSLRGFKGIAPRIAPLLLPEGAGVLAENCRLTGGALVPWNATGALTTGLTPASYLSIYRYQPLPGVAAKWFGWTTEVQCALSPIENDIYERLYFTGSGAPRVLNSAIAATGTPAYPLCFKVGCPAPGSAPTLTVTGTPSPNPPDPTTGITRAAVMTFVNEYGEESAPSAASSELTAYPGQTFHLAGLNQTILAATEYVPMDYKRVYFTNTGSSATEYQYAGDVADGVDTYDLVYAFDSFGEVLGTDGWIPPPTDLQGIVALPNGCMAGFRIQTSYAGTENTVQLSVPFQPHAWPLEYSFSVAERVVALAVFGNALLVLTSGSPTIATGTDPAALSVERLEEGYACTSRRGVVDVNGTIVYPTALGLGAIGLQGSQLVTEELFTDLEWASYYPSTLHGYHYNSHYVGFYDTGPSQGAFVFHPKTKQFATFVEAGREFTAGTSFADGNSLALYDVTGGVGRLFNTGSASTLRWESKPEQTQGDVNWGAIRVYAASYPVTVKIYESGSLQYTATVTSKEPQRLPDGSTLWGRTWQARVEGTATVYSVELATSMAEMGAQPQ